MPKRLTYAMIGGARGSFIGPIHRMALRMDNLADLVAGCFSRRAEANAKMAEALGLAPSRTYPDWASLIASERGKIDFIAICTPNDSHYAIAKAALSAGIDVMCEKPLSLTLREATELGRLAQRKGRILGIPFTYTGYPMVKAARDLIRKGALGTVCKIVLEYSQGSFRKIDFTKPLTGRNIWKMDPKIAGKSCVVADIGVHAFSLIEYVTGLETSSVLADLSNFAPGNTLDDDASVLMHFKGGAKASVVISKIATGEENGIRLRVYGDKAGLYWNQEAPNYLSVKYPFGPERIYKRNAPYMGEMSAASVRSSRIPAGHHEGFIEAFANIYDEFCKAVRTREGRDYPSVREGVRTMKFVEAVLKSNERGNRWIPFR